MKKVYSLSAIIAFLLLFASCRKDPENHLLSVVHPNSYGLLFADQESDSIVFETFDSYNLVSQDDWISITAGESYDVHYDYRNLYAFTSLLSFKPNTTGKTRIGTVRINSYEYSSAAVFYQFGYMNIRRPAPQATEMEDSVAFTLNVPASAAQDSICFNVSKPWTLSYADIADLPYADISDNTWVKFDKAHGAAGDNKVTIDLTPNTNTENARTIVLALTCGEVINLINIRQAAAIPTEE